MTHEDRPPTVTSAEGAPLEVPDTPHSRAFEVLCNNTARALTYALAASEPHIPHTSADLSRRLNMRQGPHPGWRVETQSSNPVRRFCHATLRPSGLFAQTTKPHASGKPVLAYQAVAEGMAESLATLGATTDWERQFMGYRLSDALGDARLQNDQSMPLNSLVIYQALYTAPGGRASLTQLVEVTGRPLRTLDRTMRALEAAGFVEKLTKTNFSHRKIGVSPPSAAYVKQYGKRLSNIGLALCTTAESLHRQGRTDIDGETLIAHLLALHPELEPDKVRYALVQYPPPFIRFTDQAEFGTKKTSYRMTPDRLAAIEDLLLRMHLLTTGDTTFTEAATTYAFDVWRKKEDVALLMAKAKPRNTPWEPEPRFTSISEITRRGLGSLTLQRLPIEPGWQRRGACTTENASLFMANGDGNLTAAEVAQAKAICSGCPVVGSCLQWALDTGQRRGIFGGMGRRDREAYKRKPSAKDLQHTLAAQG